MFSSYNFLLLSIILSTYQTLPRETVDLDVHGTLRDIWPLPSILCVNLLLRFVQAIYSSIKIRSYRINYTVTYISTVYKCTIHLVTTSSSESYVLFITVYLCSDLFLEKWLQIKVIEFDRMRHFLNNYFWTRLSVWPRKRFNVQWHQFHIKIPIIDTDVLWWFCCCIMLFEIC